MEQILRQIELCNLVENFTAQRVDVETVVAASDGELPRLGVETVGDRVRLREACRRSRRNGQPLSSISEAVVERAHLFNISRPSTSRQPGRSKSNGRRNAQKPKPWSPQFVCLADAWSSCVPTATQNEILKKAGLGLKKITLDVTDDEEKVTAKIVSDKLDEDGEPKGFPQLKEVGSFEMLYCAANSRDLCLLKFSRAAKVLKKIFLVKARFI